MRIDKDTIELFQFYRINDRLGINSDFNSPFHLVNLHLLPIVV